MSTVVIFVIIVAAGSNRHTAIGRKEIVMAAEEQYGGVGYLW